MTICTKERAQILGTVVGGGVLDAPCVQLSEFGVIVERRIQAVSEQYDRITIPHYVIMPNHLHMMIVVEEGSSRTPTPTNQTIPALVSTIKRMTNRDAGVVLWQRGYHDHIIRDENDFLRHWNYIDINPAKWSEDEYYCV